MAAVFGPSQDGESENSRNASDDSFALVGEAPSLVTFFGKTKKVTRRQAKALDIRSCYQAVQSQHHRPDGRVTFFLLAHCAAGANGEAGPKGEHRRCESKKVTKENGPLEQGKPAVGE